MPDFRSTRVILAICFGLWMIIVVDAMMSTKGPEAFVKTVPQSEIQAYAKEKLASLQMRSFSEDQELCAIIFEDSEGELGTTALITGEKASCDIAYFDKPGMAPVASFHTHGSFDQSYDSEVPSLLDMTSDIGSGLDGYVSTPGGRFWRIDALAETATEICGKSCLSQDPKFVPCDAYPPATSYTFAEMQARTEGDSGYC